MKKKTSPAGDPRRLQTLRVEKGLTQREVAEKAHITESAYRAYELGDRTPKPELLPRLGKALGVRPEYLSAPTFKNNYEFAYALLEHENSFGYTIRDIDGTPVIGIGCGNQIDFFHNLISEWNDMRQKLDEHEITKGEYAEWKHTWDPTTWVVDGKSPYTGK